ncbi:acyltransferase family protein [Cognatilysobacter lacus]|uniref:Acyltransferase family protein n=1 Tax=Cognatilysobacter lacus TaxID=1643323 RepID=A0A5D8Z085_9GAMM|nr:acyltransferase family protein [Lysobacter lacus]TZF87472.1 acyltransferase family protein [Lysobacter lacus]
MNRRHHIDALRALAFALLILYHWGMLYVGGDDWRWHIKSSHTYEWLQLPMLFVNRWRMSLIFLVSGISSAYLFARCSPLSFLGQRTWRLLLPLVFGMLVIVPVQPYVQGIQTGFVKPGFVDFLLRYYEFRPWPKGAFDGDASGVTWNHLWYLAYLWAFTVALVLLRPLLDSRAGLRLRDAVTGLRGGWLLLLPALPIAIETVLLQGRFKDTGDLVHDGYRDVLYFTAFLYGYWLARADGAWAEFARLRRRSLGCALALFPVYYWLGHTLPDDLPGAQALIWTLRSLYIWLAISAVLGWSKACLDRPFAWLGWANEAVFPWYVLHQSLIIAIAYVLVPLRLPVQIEAPAVLAGTVAGCWLGFAVIRRVPMLRPLFGMKLRERRVSLPGTASLGRARDADLA